MEGFCKISMVNVIIKYSDTVVGSEEETPWAG